MLAVLLGALSAFFTAKSGAPSWAVALSPLLGTLPPLIVEPLIALSQWRSERARGQRAAAPESLDGNLPRARDLSLEQFRVHRGVVAFPYSPREVDEEVQRRIHSNKRVLIVGRSMVGKTRLATESILKTHPRYRIWRPTSGRAVTELIANGNSLHRCIVWLDDLERFLGADGVTPIHLEALAAGENVIVGTIRGSALEGLAPDKDAKPLGSEVPRWFGEPVWVRGWSADEIDAALERDVPPVSRDEVRAYGLGPYLGGAPWIRERLEIGQTEGSHGFQVVRALAQVRRCGLQSGVPRESLALAVRAVEPQLELNEAQIADALHWAEGSTGGSLSAIKPLAAGTRLSVPDIVLEYFEERAQVPSTEVWKVAIEAASDDELVDIGEAAYLNGLVECADEAWRASLHPRAKYYVGGLLVDAGDPQRWPEAERLLRKAVEQGIGEAKTHLAVLLEKQAGGTYSYVAEAHALYKERAEEDPLAAFNAGVCELRLSAGGSKQEAERFYRMALAGGHRLARGRLSDLLVSTDRRDEAHALLEEGCRVESPLPQDMSALGQFLVSAGRLDEGESWLRRALPADRLEASVGLAKLALARQTPASLAEARSLLESEAVGERDLRYLRGAVALASGLTTQGESLLRSGHMDGDVECSLLLAEHLAGKGPVPAQPNGIFSMRSQLPGEVVDILSTTARAGHPEVLVVLADLYDEHGHVDQAIAACREAVALGVEDARHSLAVKLVQRGTSDDITEADNLFVELLEAAETHDGDAYWGLVTNRALVLRLQKRETEAETLLRRAARADFAGAMMNLAILLDQRGERRQAARWYGRAARRLEGQPNHAVAVSLGEDFPQSQRHTGGWLFRRLRRIVVWGMLVRSLEGPYTVWAICKRCALPFEIPSGLFLATDTQSAYELGLDRAIAGPCPHCWARLKIRWGIPLLILREKDDGLAELSGNYGRTFRAHMSLAVSLAYGDLTVTDCTEWLRSSDGPLVVAGRLFSDSEVTPQEAGSLIAASVAIIGPANFIDDQAHRWDNAQVEAAVHEVFDYFSTRGNLPRLRVRRYNYEIDFP